MSSPSAVAHFCAHLFNGVASIPLRSAFVDAPLLSPLSASGLDEHFALAVEKCFFSAEGAEVESADGSEVALTAAAAVAAQEEEDWHVARLLRGFKRAVLSIRAGTATGQRERATRGRCGRSLSAAGCKCCSKAAATGLILLSAD